MIELNLTNLEDLARGTAFLATGGGGDPSSVARPPVSTSSYTPSGTTRPSSTTRASSPARSTSHTTSSSAWRSDSSRVL